MWRNLSDYKEKVVWRQKNFRGRLFLHGDNKCQRRIWEDNDEDKKCKKIFNLKDEDDIILLQKDMIFSKVTSDIDAVNIIMMSMEEYYDLILTTAEQIYDKHGLCVVPLREQHEKLELEVEKRRSEAM